jgi:GTP cyclohydrolase II
MSDRVESVRPHLVAVPTSREPLSLLTVDRAVGELRRGRPVVVHGSEGRAAVVQAAETISADALAALREMTRSEPLLVITQRRAAVLGLRPSGLRVVRIAVEGSLTAEMVQALADPFSRLPSPLPFPVSACEVSAYGCEAAAVKLAKIARLLPSAVSADLRDIADLAAWAARHNLLLADTGDVFQYERIAARSIRPVSQARVPLLGAEETRIVAFRPRDGGLEHLALILGDPRPELPVLTRLHSQCFTGDLLGSLRCDCGDQLRGAIREISLAGGGILLYLTQEGRGIGLVNKLRAYELQDDGFDTVDANEQLGFDADERVYLPAAQMLRQLGFQRVRLLTNNPEKVTGLSRFGITVDERVPHSVPSNRHNERYIRTKAERGGHLF